MELKKLRRGATYRLRGGEVVKLLGIGVNCVEGKIINASPTSSEQYCYDSPAYFAEQVVEVIPT